MTHDPYLTYLTHHLSPARLKHSIGVMQIMEELTPIYGIEPLAARIAGLVHDAGKELSQVRSEEIAKLIDYPLVDPSDHDPLYLHGPCSAYVAQYEMGISDPLVLEAIFRHSYVGSGSARSPIFCWCLRFADMLEPGRDWDDLRSRMQPQIYAGEMGKAATELMDWLIPFLESKDIIPHPKQRDLQQKLAKLFANGSSGIPNDKLPV